MYVSFLMLLRIENISSWHLSDVYEYNLKINYIYAHWNVIYIYIYFGLNNTIFIVLYFQPKCYCNMDIILFIHRRRRSFDNVHFYCCLTINHFLKALIPWFTAYFLCLSFDVWGFFVMNGKLKAKPSYIYNLQNCFNSAE